MFLLLVQSWGAWPLYSIAQELLFYVAHKTSSTIIVIHMHATDRRTLCMAPYSQATSFIIMVKP